MPAQLKKALYRCNQRGKLILQRPFCMKAKRTRIIETPRQGVRVGYSIDRQVEVSLPQTGLSLLPGSFLIMRSPKPDKPTQLSFLAETTPTTTETQPLINGHS